MIMTNNIDRLIKLADNLTEEYNSFGEILMSYAKAIEEDLDRLQRENTQLKFKIASKAFRDGIINEFERKI